MTTPAWYGQRYPSQADLLAYAEQLGALVGFCDLDGEAIFFAGDGAEPPVILLPKGVGPLLLAWSLAHELGHLVQHTGAKTKAAWSKGEAQANRWAACALIPWARIQQHQNASLDAFIGALSSHYEELELTASPSRNLAARIAKIRLKAVEDERGDENLLSMSV